MMKKYLLLYSNCILTKGHTRSVICDLQKEKLIFIPNSLANLLTQNRYIAIDEVMSQIDNESLLIFQEYLDYLIVERIGFLVDKDDLPLFPPMNDEYLFPAQISNCIIDSNGDLPYLNDSFLSSLAALCCNYLQIRFFESVEIDFIISLIKIIHPSQIKSVELIIPDSKQSGFTEDVVNLVNQYRKIQTVIIHSSDGSCLLKEADIYGFGKILSTAEKITSQHHCGIVDHNYFSININHYNESLKYNTCLNKKVSIDVNGNIKNCPSMKESFGNLKETTISEVVKKVGFKKYWKITKDEILVCKDCEFRNVCTDCRAYLEQPEDILSKPLKCGYDPYTCQWEEWSDNHLKQDAIEYYGMQTLTEK